MTIARQLGLDPSTVSNFFMNARRRSVDKWKDENDSPNNNSGRGVDGYDDEDLLDEEGAVAEEAEFMSQQQQTQVVTAQGQTITLATAAARPAGTAATVLVAASPAAVVQHLQQGDLNAASLDL